MEEMTLRDAQKTVDAWIQEHGGYWKPISNMLRITEEVGELARAMNNQLGEKTLGEHETNTGIATEMADILFAMICMANTLDIDLQQSLETVLQKYSERDATRWSKS